MKRILIVLFVSLLAIANGCNPGEVEDEYNAVCYSFIGISQRWSSARQSCQSYGTGFDLATVPNAFMNALLQSEIIVRFGPTSQAWIGLVGGSQWTWLDGSTGTYRNFAPGNYTPDSSSAAVLDGPSGNWFKKSKSENFYTICSTAGNSSTPRTSLQPTKSFPNTTLPTTTTTYVPTTTTTTTTTSTTTSVKTTTTHSNTSSNRNCTSWRGDSEYSEIWNGACYFWAPYTSLGDGGSDYIKKCQQVHPNSMPVSIHSQAENDMIAALSDTWWIGYYNGAWLDGTTMDYRNWGPFQPSTCAVIEDYWYPYGCTRTDYAICKVPIALL